MRDEASRAARALGAQIREARRAQGISQRALAETCGLPCPSLSNIETGKGNPTVGTLVRIGNVLGLTLAFNQLEDAE